MTIIYGAHGQPITNAAAIAIKAAFLRKQIGHYAARRMAIRHGATVRLYRIACQLVAARNHELDLDFTKLDFTHLALPSNPHK